MSAISASTDAFSVFYSYAHEDEPLRKELEKHLALLKRQGLIIGWHDRLISAGVEWAHEIDTYLNTADIILLLISASFLASDYCYSIEMKRALERHEAGEARVLPIILRPIDWTEEPSLSKLQALPTNAKPVTTWPHPPHYDEAFLNIEKGIRKVVKELRTARIDSAKLSQQIWNIPFQRNPFFTGREEILRELHRVLGKDRATALTQTPQAISGLGGIGKTQTAIEYAYRYRDEYQHVFWVTADKREELIYGFVEIANLLNLPQKNAQDRNSTITVAKRWLQEHTGWLLILDNADDLEMAQGFIPSTNKGHVLVTTRAQAMGRLAQKVEIAKMGSDEGTLFLLRRANAIASDAPLENAATTDIIEARQIVEAVDGLPLALDQAAAYIEETACGFAGYLARYQSQRGELLKRRGGLVSDHPESVATTWKLSFQKIEQVNPAATDLLQLCAFLSADAIPEEIITKGAPDLGRSLQSLTNNLFKMDAAIEELRKFSLVQRDPENKAISIHRLVQAVLKDEMSKNNQRLWAERTVRAVNRTFPNVEYKTWSSCQRLLPHALTCATLIEQYNLEFEEAARLLDQSGSYLRKRGQFLEAEPLLAKALSIRKKVLGPEHMDVAQSLNDLARTYHHQLKLVEAESLYQQALAIREKVQGKDNSDYAESLNDLASLYAIQGKYDQAAQLLLQAKAIREKVLGSEHPAVAESIGNLADIYFQLDKIIEAEQLAQQGLAISEKILGAEHPDVAARLITLSEIKRIQGKRDQADELCQRALAIDEKILGVEHPTVAQIITLLANAKEDQGKYDQAEELYHRAMMIEEKTFGPEQPIVAASLIHLAQASSKLGKFESAKPLLRRALVIIEKTYGVEDPSLIVVLESLAMMLRMTNQKREAIKLEERVKALQSKYTEEELSINSKRIFRMPTESSF